MKQLKSDDVSDPEQSRIKLTETNRLVSILDSSFFTVLVAVK